MSINSILLHVGGQHDIKQYKRDKQIAKFVMNVKTSVLSDASYHLIGQKKKPDKSWVLKQKFASHNIKKIVVTTALQFELRTDVMQRKDKQY